MLGSPSAPVTMVEYIDLQCPFCQEFETQVMPDLVKRYVRPGKVKVEVRPLAFIGADSIRGRNALVAAGRQNHAFDFAEILYDNQRTENTGWLNDAMVEQAAASIPKLNVPQLLADRNTSSVKSEAGSYDAMGNAANVNSTPTLVRRQERHRGQAGCDREPDRRAVRRGGDRRRAREVAADARNLRVFVRGRS